MDIKDLFKFNKDYYPGLYLDIIELDNDYNPSKDEYIGLIKDLITYNDLAYELYPFFSLAFTENINLDLSIDINKYIDMVFNELYKLTVDGKKDNREIFNNMLNDILNNISKESFNLIESFNDVEFLNYIVSQMDKKLIDIKDSDIPLIRKRIDLLIKTDNEKALYIYGYMHYGDTKLYNCDFNIVKETMEHLASISDNSMYQVTLGYMYFNGYGVKRDYKEAFYHFSIGLLSSNTEARYMISDMLHDGLGVKKNLSNSYKLLMDLYNEFIIDANNNIFSNSFGDACLRLSIFKDPINQTEEERIEALSYLLKAEYAVNERKTEGYYGDDYVRADIIYYLNLYKHYIKYEEKKAKYRMPLDIINFINNCNSTVRMKGRLNKKKNRFHITLSLPKGEEALVSMPKFYKSELKNKLTFDLEGDIIIHRNDFVFSDDIDMDIRFVKEIDGGLKFQSFHNFCEILFDEISFKNDTSHPINNIYNIYDFIRVIVDNSNTKLTYMVDDINKYNIGDTISIKLVDGYHDVKVIDKFTFKDIDTIIDLSLCKKIEL